MSSKMFDKIRRVLSLVKLHHSKRSKIMKILGPHRIFKNFKCRYHLHSYETPISMHCRNQVCVTPATLEDVQDETGLPTFDGQESPGQICSGDPQCRYLQYSTSKTNKNPLYT